MSKNWIYSWPWKSSRIRQQFNRGESFSMNTDTHTSGSLVKNHPQLIKNGLRTQCNTENFVPIVVPCLSTSSSSSLPSSTPMTSLRQEIDHPKSSSSSSTSPTMTPSRQEIDHPTSSSSSSTSPLMTSSTVSSESVDRQEREDPYGTDHHPATVSSESVERQERWDPYSSETSEEMLNKPTKTPKPNKNENHEQVRGDLCHSDIPEWLQEFRENLVDERVPEHRDSHVSSSHELSLEPMRSGDLGKHSVYTHFPKDRNCEICHRTKITRAPCRRRIGGVVLRAGIFWWFNYSRSQSSQWRWWISKQSSTCSRGARLGHPMDPVVSVQNKNFSGNTKELAKVLGAE